MRVEIWSDVVCPWCYIGKRRFETALARFPQGEDVEVRWRSFQLDPRAPRRSHESTVDLLRRKYGLSPEDAARREEEVEELAAAEGLVIRPDRVPANTFDAHRLLHLAAERGRQDALQERLFAAYFAEGEVVSDRDTLLRLAQEAGLEEKAARLVLEGDAYAEAVEADATEARTLGARGVPFFVLGRRYAVSGAQPAELFLRALERAWAERPPAVESGEARGRGPDG